LDPHGGDVGSYMDEFCMQLRTWACLRNLVDRLKSTTVPEGRLFDLTTVVFSTELDRLHYHNVGNATSTRVGTNHGETASVIMAGAGIRKGAVVGDFNHGPNVYPIASYGKDNYLKPVPIDPTFGHGQADPKGEVTSTLSLLPTVLAAFGISVPPQQKSDHLAVAAVLAKDPPKDTT
jgi:hypothetical protein